MMKRVFNLHQHCPRNLLLRILLWVYYFNFTIKCKLVFIYYNTELENIKYGGMSVLAKVLQDSDIDSLTLGM